VDHRDRAQSYKVGEQGGLLGGDDDAGAEVPLQADYLKEIGIQGDSARVFEHVLCEC
jgi:hypothetical protein